MLQKPGSDRVGLLGPIATNMSTLAEVLWSGIFQSLEITFVSGVEQSAAKKSAQ